LKVKKHQHRRQTVKFVKAFSRCRPYFAANGQKRKGIGRDGRFFQPVRWTSVSAFP